MSTVSHETERKENESNQLSYKGPVSGLKGLLTSKIAEGLAAVSSTLDTVIKKEGGTEKIAIDQIHPCADQPRQFFDPASLEELAKTMGELGQAQAITVRKTANGYEIISGERRYRAAKLAGLKAMDCLVKECSAMEGRLLALVENTQRQDLLPIEEALYLKKVLAENPELSLEKLAKKLGSHKSTLSEKIQLTEIPEDLQPALYSKGAYFTHRHWRVISRIDDVSFLRDVFKNAIEHKLSVAELEKSLAAAGVKKAIRNRRVESLLDTNFRLISKDGAAVKVRSLSFDMARIPADAAIRIATELKDLATELELIAAAPAAATASASATND